MSSVQRGGFGGSECDCDALSGNSFMDIVRLNGGVGGESVLEVGEGVASEISSDEGGDFFIVSACKRCFGEA